MPYATQDDLIDRVGERMLIDLTDREDVPTGVIDAGIVARAIADAEAEINGYLKDRYTLPMAEVPPALLRIACTLALQNLHTNEPSKKQQSDWDHSQRKLREIANGTFRLPIEGVEPADKQASGVRITDRDRPITQETMKGYI